MGNIADLSEEKGVIILRDMAVAGSCVTLVITPTLAIQRLDTLLLSNFRTELRHCIPLFFFFFHLRTPWQLISMNCTLHTSKMFVINIVAVILNFYFVTVNK